MFGQAEDLFANIPAEHRPDRPSAPVGPPTQAAVPAVPPGQHGHMASIGTAPSPDGLGYTAPFEPDDVSPEAAMMSAGFTTLGVVAAFGIGVAAGGWKGGLAGILLMGGTLNTYRAQKWWGSPEPSEKHEAVVSGVMGAATLVGGVYAAYKAYEGRKEDSGD